MGPLGVAAYIMSKLFFVHAYMYLVGQYTCFTHAFY